MNRHVFFMAFLSLFMATPPSSFAQECVCPPDKSADLNKSKRGKHHKNFDSLSIAEIKRGMSILKKAVKAPMPKNKFFAHAQDMHDFFDDIIDEAHDDTKATTGLSQMVANFYNARKINPTNFPHHLVSDIKNTIKKIYRDNHGKIHHSLDKNEFETEGLKAAWEGLATGDIIIAGNLLAALKGLQLSKSKATFKEDFESRFPDFETLYAISMELENFITTISHRLEDLRRNPHIGEQYKYQEIFDHLQKEDFKAVLDQISENIFHGGDQFISIILLEALVGLNVEGSFQELDTLRDKLHTQLAPVAQNIKNFLDNYYYIYGHSHHMQPSPQDIAKNIVVKPKEPAKAPPTTAVVLPTPTVQPPAKVETKPEAVKKAPPEIPGYTIKPYRNGKLWYFRGNHPVKPTPE